MWLVAVSMLVVLAPHLEHVRAVAHAACTWGTEPGTTCGEALWLLGYPS